MAEFYVSLDKDISTEFIAINTEEQNSLPQETILQIERAYNVDVGAENYREFLRNSLEDFKQNGKNVVKIIGIMGAVLSSKTYTTNETLPIINKKLSEYDLLDKTTIHHMEWDVVENKAGELVLKILNGLASESELIFFAKQIELLRSENAFKEDKNHLGQIINNLPIRFFEVDKEREPDPRLFLALTRTYITIEVEEILKNADPFTLIVIDAPSGTEFKDHISNRSYATKIFTDLAKSQSVFKDIARESYSLSYANIVAGPKIFILAFYRHLLSNIGSLKQAQYIANYIGVKPPKDKKEWKKQASGGSISMSFAADEAFIEQMAILGFDITKSARLPVNIDEIRDENVQQIKELYTTKNRKKLIHDYLPPEEVDAFIDANLIIDILNGVIPDVERFILLLTQWRLKSPLLFALIMKELKPDQFFIGYNSFPDFDISKTRSLYSLVKAHPKLIE